MKNEITLMKLNERFFSRQNEKNLNVIFEYSYFSYVNEIVFVVIQIQQQTIVIVESSISKSKKKSNANASTFIMQLNREIDIRKSVRNEFDQRFDALMKLYRCKKQNCDNYQQHC